MAKGRFISKEDLSEGIKILESSVWPIAIGDDFGGGFIGNYKVGPALVNILNRIKFVIELSPEEQAEIANLEKTDPQLAQKRIEEIVKKKAEVFFDFPIQQFRAQLPSVFKSAVASLAETVVQQTLAQFDGGKRAHKQHAQGRPPIFANRGELIYAISYAQKLIEERGETPSLSKIATEIRQFYGKKNYSYRQLERHMKSFKVKWSKENGAY
jgi:hypothetical protein